jgi:mannose/fructose/N-acetylgalactosamine-specific phosphotransferase system component IIC
MHQLPIIAALLISLLCGAVATSLVVGIDIPPDPGFGVF